LGGKQLQGQSRRRKLKGAGMNSWGYGGLVDGKVDGLSGIKTDE